MAKSSSIGKTKPKTASGKTKKDIAASPIEKKSKGESSTGGKKRSAWIPKFPLTRVKKLFSASRSAKNAVEYIEAIARHLTILLVKEATKNAIADDRTHILIDDMKKVAGHVLGSKEAVADAEESSSS